MSYADKTVQLTIGEVPEIDYQRASGAIVPQAGVVVVENWPARFQTQSGLVLPDSLTMRYGGLPDVGTVLASAIPSLIPGDVVCFNHEHGKRISGFAVPGYETDRIVRMFGRSVTLEAKVNRIPWFKTIFGRIELEDGKVTGTLRATGKKVLVRRNNLRRERKIEGTDLSIHLTDKMASRDSTGIVISVGELVNAPVKMGGCGLNIREGDRVCYMANPVKHLPPLDDLRDVLADEYFNEDLVFMDADAVLCNFAGVQAEELVSA